MRIWSSCGSSKKSAKEMSVDGSGDDVVAMVVAVEAQLAHSVRW